MVTVRADDLRVVLDEVGNLDYPEPSQSLVEAYDRLHEADCVAQLYAELQSVSNNRKDSSG